MVLRKGFIPVGLCCLACEKLISRSKQFRECNVNSCRIYSLVTLRSRASGARHHLAGGQRGAKGAVRTQIFAQAMSVTVHVSHIVFNANRYCVTSLILGDLTEGFVAEFENVLRDVDLRKTGR